MLKLLLSPFTHTQNATVELKKVSKKVHQGTLTIFLAISAGIAFRLNFSNFNPCLKLDYQPL